jgi:hypothetical protein
MERKHRLIQTEIFLQVTGISSTLNALTKRADTHGQYNAKKYGVGLPKKVSAPSPID